MKLIITPARTLFAGDTHCTSSSIECQLSGTRVCIDSLTACDGVPNCGSYGNFYSYFRCRLINKHVPLIKDIIMLLC